MKSRNGYSGNAESLIDFAVSFFYMPNDILDLQYWASKIMIRDKRAVQCPGPGDEFAI